MAQIYRDDLKRNWTLTGVRIFQDERDNNNMETSNSSITPRIIYMEQEVRRRWSFRTCKYIEGIECHCVLTVFVLYNLSLSLSLFLPLLFTFSFSRGVLSPRTMRYFSFQTGSVAVQSLSTAQCPFSRFTGMKTYRSSNGRQPSVIEHPIEKNSTWRKIRLASGHHF